MIRSKNILLALTLIFSLVVSQNSFAFLKNFRSSSQSQSILDQNLALNPKVLDLAVKAYKNAEKKGEVKKPFLTIIDYSLPSTEKRLWLVDLRNKKVLLHTWVAHGSGSGLTHAERFSNIHGSHQTSLGVFVTGGTYQGRHGTSLRLHGLEEGINHRAESRGIVIHGAPYVSERYLKNAGRLGRSWGCPAISFDVSKRLIETIKNGSVVFSYYPQKSWLKTSKYL
ncbi:MAG: murein L,D-transpeptidase catalytic domain family protein [Gammaproteobacteria bacterium]